MNMQDFYTGHAFDAYEFFGAHTYFGGTHFAVWAPSAQHIAVETEIGTFDLHRTQSAVWECDAPGVQAGIVYQYWVRGANGQSVAHCDPYGTAMTLRPDGRSIVSDAPKGFADDKWMQERTKCFDKPLNIYEVHAGSWRQKEDGSWYTYAELADLLPAYCKKSGFTHIELMPLAEHPFDGSWGYQTTGFFAPTSRYGTPDELVEFVNACHKQGIGVILDFVPVHFAVDAYGLKEFDGTPLYEYPAAAVGQSEWGSCNFMHSRGEIRCFIQSCADYWLRVFHADGLRKDAEIYTIFDTEKLLNRPASVQVGKTSGLAGIAYWINQNYHLTGEKQIDKHDPLVLALKGWVDAEYEDGRQTVLSVKELKAKIAELAPGRFAQV